MLLSMCEFPATLSVATCSAVMINHNALKGRTARMLCVRGLKLGIKTENLMIESTWVLNDHRVKIIAIS